MCGAEGAGAGSRSRPAAAGASISTDWLPTAAAALRTAAVLLVCSQLALARQSSQHTAGVTAELYPPDVRQRPTADQFYIFATPYGDYDDALGTGYSWYDESAGETDALQLYDWQHKRRAYNILEQLLDRMNTELGRRRIDSVTQR